MSSAADAESVTANDVSLDEFVTLLVLRLESKHISMPFQNEENWHRLFYKFKGDQSKSGRPAFMDRLRFDWDGPYPKCQALSECLQTLHWNGFVSVANPSYDRLSVDAAVAERAEQVGPMINDPELERYLEASTEDAATVFAK